jgi:hypothetical protein
MDSRLVAVAVAEVSKVVEVVLVPAAALEQTATQTLHPERAILEVAVEVEQKTGLIEEAPVVAVELFEFDILDLIDYLMRRPV